MHSDTNGALYRSFTSFVGAYGSFSLASLSRPRLRRNGRIPISSEWMTQTPLLYGMIDRSPANTNNDRRLMGGLSFIQTLLCLYQKFSS
jgi:hypothetical protein